MWNLPHAREIIAQSAKHYSGRSLRTVLAYREVLVYYSGDAEKGNPERRE